MYLLCLVKLERILPSFYLLSSIPAPYPLIPHFFTNDWRMSQGSRWHVALSSMSPNCMHMSMLRKELGFPSLCPSSTQDLNASIPWVSIFSLLLNSFHKFLWLSYFWFYVLMIPNSVPGRQREIMVKSPPSDLRNLMSSSKNIGKPWKGWGGSE